MIFRSLESSRISFLAFFIWAQLNKSPTEWAYILIIAATFWLLHFYQRLWSVGQICRRVEAEYRRIEKMTEIEWVKKSSSNTSWSKDLNLRPSET